MIVVCGLEDCPVYRDPQYPMIRLREKETVWVCQCRVCGRLRAVPKAKVGGTIGAGESDHVPPKTRWAMGAAFHD